MQKPEEHKNASFDPDVIGALELVDDFGIDELVGSVGGFLGDAVGGILDGISIDI